jgi:preprotein translocase subunit SecG
MSTVLLVLQIFIVLLLIGVVLLQRTGADGLAGLSGGGHNIMSGKASANALTRITILLAFAFMANSLVLARLAAHETKKPSLAEQLQKETPLLPPMIGGENNGAPAK